MDNPIKSYISWSQYSMWKRCPQWWDFIYRQKLGIDDQSIHTLFGTAIHATIQRWLVEMVYGGKSIIYAKSVDLSDVFREDFIKECQPWVDKQIFVREEIEEFYQHGVDILSYIQENVTKLFPTKNTELFAIEYRVAVPLGPGMEYIGYIDIVTRDMVYNEWTLYDLKSSTRGWNQWQKKDKNKTDQLLVYKKLFAEEQKIPFELVDVEYVILKRTLPDYSDWPSNRVTKFSPAQGITSLKRVWKSFSEFLSLAHHPETGERIGDHVVATPSDSACKFCPCQEICPSFKKPNGKRKETLVTL